MFGQNKSGLTFWVVKIAGPKSSQKHLEFIFTTAARWAVVHHGS